MTITARYDGRCSACGGRISAGQAIEWDKASRTSKHVDCGAAKKPAAPAQPLASVPGGARAPRGRNRKPGSCERCGAYLAVGEGILTYCEYDTGCMVHMHESGYHLWCADEATCKASKAAAAAARENARKAKIEAALAGLRALTEPIRLSYREGEYLSGYVTSAAAALLTELGLAKYVSGWGDYVEPRLAKALGTEFTGVQAADYAAGGAQ